MNYIIFSLILGTVSAGVIQIKDDYPADFDWREKGVILPVRNQGQCGSPVSFNALDAISAAEMIVAKKPLVQLSLQQVVDCVPNMCPCGGSFGVSYVYSYLMKNHSIDSEASYPYTGTCDNQCHFTKSGTAANIIGYGENQTPDEHIMLEELTKQPLTVEINAALESFQFYTGGIYDDPACTAENRDHVLLLVGYGVDSDGKEFWIARNSWGKSWGENGYIRIARNHGNRCGIASKWIYPIVSTF